jgi:heme exporter protein D
MHWSSWSEFFSMGGYALYVWGSYGVTFLLLGAEVLVLLNRKRKVSQRPTRPE